MIDGVELGGKQLVFDLGALAALQRELKIEDLQPVFDKLGGGKVDAVTMSTLLWAGFLHGEDRGKFKVDDAAAAVRGLPIKTVLEAIGEAFKESFGDASADEGNASPAR